MKTFFALVLAVCCFQALVAVPVDDQDWQDTFNSVINKLNDALTKAKAFIDDEAKKIEDVIAGEIKKGYDVVDQKILEVTEEATEKGIDIGPCIDEQKKLVDTDIDQIVQGAIGCITNRIDEAINDLQAVVTAIKDTEQALVDSSNSIDACHDESSWKEAACIAEETAKAVAKAADSDEKAVKAIADIAVLYETFPEQIKKCEQDQLKAAGDDALKVAENVALCVIF